jgi:hypothetical protein
MGGTASEKACGTHTTVYRIGSKGGPEDADEADYPRYAAGTHPDAQYLLYLGMGLPTEERLLASHIRMVCRGYSK